MSPRFRKATIITLSVLAGLFVIGVLFGDTDDDPAPAPAAAQPQPPPPPASKPPPPLTPQERVRQAIGATVEAGGYAGTLEVQDVFFDAGDALVTVTTPEGGFQGASCGDLDDGSQAVFQTVYEAGWNGGAVTVFKGGLVDTSTGQPLPRVTTGVYTMPGAQARRIEWSSDDVLLAVDWSLYRDFCHPALN